jgi:D-aspartate ligase
VDAAVSNAGEGTSPRKGAIVLGGAHGSLETARSLGRRGIPVWLVTSDNPLASLSRFVEVSLRWSGPRDSGALTFLADLAHRHGLDGWVLFAGSDDDVWFVAQNHTALGALFTLTTPAWDKIRWTNDKRAMNARADELGIAHPLTRQVRSRDELVSLGISFPVVLKPAIREGRNAFVDAKAWRADDEATLCTRFDEAKALVGADTIMIQELVPGDGTAQYSYAAVWDRGKPVA